MASNLKAMQKVRVTEIAGTLSISAGGRNKEKVSLEKENWSKHSTENH